MLLGAAAVIGLKSTLAHGFSVNFGLISEHRFVRSEEDFVTASTATESHKHLTLRVFLRFVKNFLKSRDYAPFAKEMVDLAQRFSRITLLAGHHTLTTTISPSHTLALKLSTGLPAFPHGPSYSLGFAVHMYGDQTVGMCE